jgi:hypothetical protein
LPIDYLNGWLFGINAKRVKEDVRDRLIIYQERCYKYKQLPAHKFDRAMEWLTSWYQRVTGSTGDELPF